MSRPVFDAPLIRAGKRYGLTMAEAEEGCRALIEKMRPVALDASMFTIPELEDDGRHLIERHIRAVRAQHERRERQAAFVLFGIHL